MLLHRTVSRTLLLLVILLTFGAALPWAQEELFLDTPERPVPAPPFSASTADGGTVSLEQLRGRVVFLNFWATWCVPCLAEMPAMETLNQAMRGQPFSMLAVNFEEGEALVRKFLKDKSYSFPIVLDPHGAVNGQYGVANLPLTFIIGKDGQVLHRALGPRVWDGAPSIAFFHKLTAAGGQ